MPNFDGGHYFLTTLIPVRTDLVADPRSTAMIISHVHALRQVLIALPTALQTPATERIGQNSPFARNRATHFARFTVMDDVAFNGRGQRDPIKVALAGPEPHTRDTVDRLPFPYLMFVADFDAADGSPEALATWLRDIWAVMAPELRDILSHCQGDATDADSFVSLITRCQVETTMPFNDYWPGAPPLSPLPLKQVLAPAGVAALVFVVGLIGMMLAHHHGWRLLMLLGLAGIVVGLWYAYREVMTKGALPFPPAPGADLPGVLKALYLQQRFTSFAIDTQGKDDAALHAAFGDFLRDHKPEDTAAPTQPPGVVRA
ncbi:hypothetical protein ACQW02_22015 [Humitalea sp. 24SJ18S-53]|uniref:hypothetical protein n=1 Tax=Humitalea sp. 24SJ18S-53 TaxID=3422307 RepID=UPI003D679DE8